MSRQALAHFTVNFYLLATIMNIRKHWKKLLLTTTAFFWASCTSENSTQPLYGVPCAPEGCGNPRVESSSSDDVESSSSDALASSSSEANAPSSSSIEESSSSEAVASSSSESTSSSSGEVTCVPGDSLVSYYPPYYSESVAKSNAEQKANHGGVTKIDSVSNTLQTVPQCLADLRQELDMFVALYGAPDMIHKDEVCSDGTTRPTQEYLNYLKMKEEWEKNKPALDAECQKIYEDKLKEIEAQINNCLATSNPNTDLTVCDLEAMCPVYGVTSSCIYNYQCKDGVSCDRGEGDSNIYCTDKQGERVTYTQNQFKKKYYTKNRY